MTLTDSQLALWHLGKLTLPEGEHEAPAARLVIRGRRARIFPRAELAAEAAVLAPDLAATLAASLPEPVTSPLGPSATLSSLATDYTPAAATGEAVPHTEFITRRAACLACPLWRSHSSGLQGHCDHIACRCSRRLLWPIAETCPAGKWPA